MDSHSTVPDANPSESPGVEVYFSRQRALFKKNFSESQKYIGLLRCENICWLFVEFTERSLDADSSRIGTLKN